MPESSIVEQNARLATREQGVDRAKSETMSVNPIALG
jgi:hypothetical protein